VSAGFYACVCVYVFVRACACACVCMCVCACVCVNASVSADVFTCAWFPVWLSWCFQLWDFNLSETRLLIAAPNLVSAPLVLQNAHRRPIQPLSAQYRARHGISIPTSIPRPSPAPSTPLASVSLPRPFPSSECSAVLFGSNCSGSASVVDDACTGYDDDDDDGGNDGCDDVSVRVPVVSRTCASDAFAPIPLSLRSICSASGGVVVSGGGGSYSAGLRTPSPQVNLLVNQYSLYTPPPIVAAAGAGTASWGASGSAALQRVSSPPCLPASPFAASTVPVKAHPVSYTAQYFPLTGPFLVSASALMYCDGTHTRHLPHAASLKECRPTIACVPSIHGYYCAAFFFPVFTLLPVLTSVPSMHVYCLCFHLLPLHARIACAVISFPPLYSIACAATAVPCMHSIFSDNLRPLNALFFPC
jgi:hypothetical protein